jgi:hypothetical protein
LRKTVSILIIMLLLIITGCSKKQVVNHNYTYKGENEFWAAEYNVNGEGTFTEKDGKTEYESISDTVLTVTYKKDLSGLSSVKHLEISYESSAGGGSLTESYDSNNPLDKKTYTLKSGGTGTAIENKDEIIKVNINVDGETQTIELSSKK